MLIEDNNEDLAALRRIVNDLALRVVMHRCVNGDEGLEYLSQYGKIVADARPSLLLLDLNLPGMDGRTVLTRIKADDALKAVPVVVLTTSDSPCDVAECYRSGANSYQVRTVNYPVFKLTVERLLTYWLSDCLLPSSAEK